MKSWKVLLLVGVGFLFGCKTQIEVPSGGSVISVSGDYVCDSGQICVFDIFDTSFDETFVAAPNPGMKFVHWKVRPNGLFGGSRSPEVRLMTGWFGAYPAMMEFLNSDQIFYLEPVFEMEALPEAPVAGGSPASPATLSLTAQNEIASNVFFNYFKHSAQEGEVLILHSLLSRPLSDQEKSRCASSDGTTVESSYDTQIHIFNSNMERVGGRCAEGLIFKFETAGDYILQFDYPSNAPGYAVASSLIGDSAIAAPSGELGSPSSPRSIISGASHSLSEISFYNYFRYAADQGDRVIIHTVLDRPLSPTQKSRCASNSGDGARPSGYDTQIHVYDVNMNRVGGKCGEDLDFVFPETGAYIIHFSYGTQNSGYFNAAVIR